MKDNQEPLQASSSSAPTPPGLHHLMFPEAAPDAPIRPEVEKLLRWLDGLLSLHNDRPDDACTKAPLHLGTLRRIETSLREANERAASAEEAREREYRDAVRGIRLLTEDFVRMSRRRDKAEAERDSWRDRAAKAEQELADAKSICNDASARYVRAEQELDEADAELAEANATIERAIALVDGTRLHRDKLRAERDQANARFASLSSEIEKLPMRRLVNGALIVAQQGEGGCWWYAPDVQKLLSRYSPSVSPEPQKNDTNG